MGAALLAGGSTGAFASPAEAADHIVRTERTFEPDPTRHAIYEDRLARYRQLYPALRPIVDGL